MKRAPQIIGCLLLVLGGLACDVIPINIPLDDGTKSLPETGVLADAAARDADEGGDGMSSHADGVVPPWGDAGTSPGDGGLGDGWPGDGSAEGLPSDGATLDGEPEPDGLPALDAGSAPDGGAGD